MPDEKQDASSPDLPLLSAALTLGGWWEERRKREELIRRLLERAAELLAEREADDRHLADVQSIVLAASRALARPSGLLAALADEDPIDDLKERASLARAAKAYLRVGGIKLAPGTKRKEAGQFIDRVNHFLPLIGEMLGGDEFKALPEREIMSRATTVMVNFCTRRWGEIPILRAEMRLHQGAPDQEALADELRKLVRGAKGDPWRGDMGHLFFTATLRAAGVGTTLADRQIPPDRRPKKERSATSSKRQNRSAGEEKQQKRSGARR